MICEQIRPLLTAWLDQQLTKEETLQVGRHLADCLTCTQMAEQYRGVLVSALHNQTDETYPQMGITNNAPDLWDGIEKRILAEMQAEEKASLRRELEQMQGILRALQTEVAQLRRQVNAQNQAAKQIPCVLMPGTQSAPDTSRLRFLL